VSRYWHDAMVQIDDFKNEGVVASSSWEPWRAALAKTAATACCPVASLMRADDLRT